MRVLLFVVRCLSHWHRVAWARVRVCLLVLCQLFALANIGCASSSLAARFPQARVEPVCVRISGIEYDANHWVYTSDGRAISSFDADVFAHLASQPGAIIYTFDGEAPRDSANRLPAPDNQIRLEKGLFARNRGKVIRQEQHLRGDHGLRNKRVGRTRVTRPLERRIAARRRYGADLRRVRRLGAFLEGVSVRRSQLTQAAFQKAHAMHAWAKRLASWLSAARTSFWASLALGAVRRSARRA
jgi:hypothetical protein